MLIGEQQIGLEDNRLCSSMCAVTMNGYARKFREKNLRATVAETQRIIAEEKKMGAADLHVNKSMTTVSYL